MEKWEDNSMTHMVRNVTFFSLILEKKTLLSWFFGKMDLCLVAAGNEQMTFEKTKMHNGWSINDVFYEGEGDGYQKTEFLGDIQG